MQFRILFASSLTVVCASVAQAADPKLVTFYKETCGVCHGENGEGTPGLAPPLKGNKFITEGSAAEIAATITKGREGAAKRYKDLASPMPPASMSDSRLQALIAYLKTDLQK
jgi:mono/diheme cytochrome c family protein